MFVGSRQQVLDALRVMGGRLCGYNTLDTWVEGRCDCKYGVEEGKWPTISSEKTGCPELRSLYEIVGSITDDEWRLLTSRNGNSPSGMALFGTDGIADRLLRADAAAAMAQHNIAELRRALALNAPLALNAKGAPDA